ncbi:MAG: hypothetical protein O7A03_05360 [Alphaproteobacteria bacterium]|nr:hypothetical protein [Alphaproteobacteria bacterium]
MQRAEILEEISGYCRIAGLAESTFGRRAVNDGKLVSRIRDGGRITERTLGRIHAFIADNPPDAMAQTNFIVPHNGGGPRRVPDTLDLETQTGLQPAKSKTGTGEENFRFFDNRQKYLLFVNTCSEKEVIAQRVTLELANIKPRPPAVRVFDAGMGDGSVLSRVMRSMHTRFRAMPFYIVAKEISLEDVRLSLDKMPDRFHEHPATVLVVTNLYYSESPWLTTNSSAAASSFVWKECALEGDTAHEFEEQITELGPFLAENWQARIGARGNPVYDRPVALVIYRRDHKFLLDQVIPKRGATEANFDLIMASQPYRARSPVEFKAQKVLAPLARALGSGGRLIGIHSYGHDPGMEIIDKVWPGDDPFQTDRHAILKAVKKELGGEARHLNFNAYADNRSIFRYDMHTLPNEVDSSIGTSTLFAAWNAAIYVAQVEEDRVEQATLDGRYVEATRAVLRERGGLWFHDESYVISRRRD